MSNNSQLTAGSCGIVSNTKSSNAIGIVGGSTLSAATLGTVATGWDNSSNINNGGSISSGTRIVQGISSTCAPALPPAPADANCSADPLNSQSGGGATYTVGPNSAYGTTQGGNTVCYTALTIGSNGDTVTLNPGNYLINGGSLSFAGGTMHGGNGVFFYLEGNASLTIANGANVNLAAPTSGTYSGILIYQAAGDTQTMTIAGGSSTSINGAFFAPGATLALSNGSGASLRGAIVAQSLTLSGGGTLNAVANVNLGTMNHLRREAGAVTPWARLLSNNDAGERGSAVVELALTLGVFGAPLLLGTLTLVNVIYCSIEVANAAHAGAVYGMVSSTYAGDTSGIRSASQEEASDLGGYLTVSPTTYYACSTALGGMQYSSQSAATSACSGSGNHPLQFVQVVVSATIVPAFHFPKLPSTFTLTNTSVMEVLE